MKKLLIAAPMLLTATSCVTTRFVSTYCVTKAQLEELKKSQPERISGKLTGNAEEDSRILAGNLIRLRAHDDGLLEVLGGCVDPERITSSQSPG